MVRYRRYRVFFVLAVFAVGALYHFRSLRYWDDSTLVGAPTYGGSSENTAEKFPEANTDPKTTGGPEILKIEQKTTETHATTTTTTIRTSSLVTPASSEATAESSFQSTRGGVSNTASTDTVSESLAAKSAATSVHLSSISTSSTSTAAEPSITLDNSVEVVNGKDKDGTFGLGGKGRHEVPPPLSGKPIHWSRFPEHFPVPSDTLIPLPTSKPKPIPKIQFAFKDESSAAKIEREEKRNTIKEAFKHSWKGYREHAWLHDEIKPVTGGFRDPFCSWAATLVDALDTLVIMGLDEEFIEATEALSQVDFTTSPRSDLPVFETTIRYLGGLLSAHDLSHGKYQIIMNKAIELADIIMGAFDTPNRMPIMYYFWKPTFASNPHRASSRTVLAELGSLSMEFTRLAQITGKNGYYDAIARITNELEQFQPETKIPGLWPKVIDTSGCKKPEHLPQLPEDQSHQVPVLSRPRIDRTIPTTPGQVQERSRVDDWPERTVGGNAGHAANDQQLHKRQLDMDASSEKPSGYMSSPGQDPTQHNNFPADKVDCQPQGLSSPPNVLSEHFSFGGAADSTYEYLPKQYMLLGGQVPQYRKMYESAIDAANEYLLFRPMIPDNDREILVVGSANAQANWMEDPDRLFKLVPEQSHLLCFAGGMWGIGSKIFGREADMEIAEKLTDACVWAYEATKTGIMPELMSLIPCESRTDCQWNQTLWYNALDPYREQREKNQREMKERELALETKRLLLEAEAEKRTEDAGANGLEQGQATGPGTNQVLNGGSDLVPDAGAGQASGAGIELKSDEIPTTGPIAKRQNLPPEQTKKTESPPPTSKAQLGQASVVDGEPAAPYEAANRYPTHEEYVERLIRQERLPVGMSSVRSKDYILRPEAIESVFIMYRLTGDEKWREKGWKMWQSIQEATRTEYGYSAIHDVMRPDWTKNHKDQTESFWLAETLKYFYLLFSPPSHISLDDYVLYVSFLSSVMPELTVSSNTEAHPFKRPK